MNPACWLVVRHVEHVHLGFLGEIIGQRGMTYQYLDVFRGEEIPDRLETFAGLVVLGGPMGVYDAGRYRFLIRGFANKDSFVMPLISLRDPCGNVRSMAG